MIARAVGQRLEEEGLDLLFPGRYLMEVSTPGLTRKLKTERELAYGVGRRVEIRLIASIEKEPVRGVLQDVTPSELVLLVGEEGTLTLIRSEVRVVQLDLL